MNRLILSPSLSLNTNTSPGQSQANKQQISVRGCRLIIIQEGAILKSPNRITINRKLGS